MIGFDVGKENRLACKSARLFNGSYKCQRQRLRSDRAGGLNRQLREIVLVLKLA